MNGVLCFVDEPWAYFTTQPIDQQWGDDWNDAPYEHNAGRPYTFHDGDGKLSDASWKIERIAFVGPLETPCSWTPNSQYSVEMINKGLVPWLQTDRYTNGSRVQIWAGTPMDTFCTLVRQAGGMVYLPERTA
jgi:hypothetical protein